MGRVEKKYVVVSILLAVIQIGCVRLSSNYGIIHVVACENAVYAILIFLAFCFAFYFGICMLDAGAHALKKISQKKDKIFQGLFDQNAFLIILFMIILGWLPFIMLQFPGILCPDSSYQIEQAMGSMPLNLHHPLLDTLVIGAFMRAGLALGNINYGISLFCIAQTVFSALVFSYSLSTLRKLGASRVSVLICTLIVILMPNYNHFISVIIKDQLYGVFFVLFITLLIQANCEEDFVFKKKRLICLFSAAVIGLCATRNNGIHVVILTAFLHLAYSFISKKKRINLKQTLVWILPLCLFFCITKIEEIRCNPGPGMHASALSMPIQQTARYIHYYGDEVTESEKENIDGVLEYQMLSDAYNPLVSDLVKALFRESTFTNEKFVAYLSTWFNQFLKHPNVYFDAFIEQNYYLFDLSFGYNSYYSNASYKEDKKLIELGFDFPSEVLDKQNYALSLHSYIDKTPGLMMLNSMAFYCNILIMFTAVIVKDRNKRFLLVLAPLYLTILVILAGPIIYYNQRYAFPIIYSLPIIMTYYSNVKDKCNQI